MPIRVPFGTFALRTDPERRAEVMTAAIEALEQVNSRRIVISQRVRVAAVQQVSVQVVRTPDGFVMHERPRAGVYDAPLLSRMQRLVTILPAYDLTHLDFGDIAHAPPGFHAGPWQGLYGAAPSIANYLFYPQPTTMVSTTFVAAHGVAA